MLKDIIFHALFSNFIFKGKYKVPVRVPKKSAMAEDLTEDIVSLSKTEKSGSFLIKTAATSSAFAGNHFHPLLYHLTLSSLSCLNLGF